MELTPVPYRQTWSRRALALFAVLVLTPVTALALVPTAFGLERYVMSGDEMGGMASRGSVVLEQRVPFGDLEVGDVVTAPGRHFSESSPMVTRRVIAADDSTILTSADHRPSALVSISVQDEPVLSRALVGVPLVGYPFLHALAGPLRGLPFVVFGVLLGGLCLTRRQGQSDEPDLVAHRRGPIATRSDPEAANLRP